MKIKPRFENAKNPDQVSIIQAYDDVSDYGKVLQKMSFNKSNKNDF